MDPIKVLLVVEVPLIGSIFASVLEDEPDIQVAGCVAAVQDALGFIQEQEADVALISVGLPDQGALTLTRTLVDHTPAIRVLVLGLLEE
jgi:DNA-binding NarL/FixJ family response regulator